MSRARIYFHFASVTILVVAVAEMATQESVGAAAVFGTGVALAFMLGMATADRRPLLDTLEAKMGRLETRVEMLREFACCACGHKLLRHRDPKSADGYGCLDCQCQAVHRLDEGPIEPYLGRP
jgi:hypothetical protein